MDFEKKYNKLMQQYLNAIDGFISISIAYEELEKKYNELLLEKKENNIEDK